MDELTNIVHGNDMALHPYKVFRRQMHDVYVFGRRAVGYTCGRKRRVHDLSRMTRLDWLLLIWVLVEITRALFFCLVWDIGVWLFKISRPPRAVRNTLVALFLATFCRNVRR